MDIRTFFTLLMLGIIDAPCVIITISPADPDSVTCTACGSDLSDGPGCNVCDPESSAPVCGD